jgi:hypothetical protein
MRSKFHQRKLLSCFLPKSDNPSARQAKRSSQEQEGIPELANENQEVKSEGFFRQTVIGSVEKLEIKQEGLVAAEKSKDFESSAFSSLGILSLFTMAQESANEEPVVFEFPIQETEDEVKMKNINPTIFPHFHEMAIDSRRP